MTAIDTLFFDWGGVLADDPGDDFLSKLLKKVGASDDQIHEINTTYMRDFMRGTISEHEYWDALASNYGFSIHASISSEFREWKGLIVNNEVLNLVDQARARGIKTAILSNVIAPTYTVLLESGNYDRFDYIIASCMVGYAKPDQEIYELALETATTTASKSLFIDDKLKNLTPASDMGFSTILAQNPKQIIADVASYINS